jgi:hypothetical protein
MDERAAEKPVLNRTEQVLYGRLMRAFPGHIILAQVALSRLLPMDSTDAAQHAVVAFVICRADFTALAVVELTDRAGVRANPRQDQLLRTAGIKVVRLSDADIPHEPALKALVATLPLDASTSRMMRRAS